MYQETKIGDWWLLFKAIILLTALVQHEIYHVVAYWCVLIIPATWKHSVIDAKLYKLFHFSKVSILMASFTKEQFKERDIIQRAYMKGLSSLS